MALLSDDDVFGKGVTQVGEPKTPTEPLLNDADVFGSPGSSLPQKPYAPEFEDFVKGQEGYTRTPKWDFKQSSSGWGTRHRPGDPDTVEFHQQRLDEELTKAFNLVDQFHPGLPEKPRHALGDLTFNAGTEWMNSGLGQAIKAGDYRTAKERFLQYTKAGGKDMGALERRRQALSGLFDMEGDGAPVRFAQNTVGPQLLSDADIMGTAPGTAPAPTEPADALAQSPPTSPPQTPAGTTPSDHYSTTRGLVSGLLKENPETLADSLEGLAYISPFGGETLREWSGKLRDLAKLSPEEYATQSKGLEDAINSGSMDTVLTWAGETLGQGLASSVPSVVGGVGGAAIGGGVGTIVAPGPGTAAGATIGGIGGALAASAPLNHGDAFKTLKDAGLDADVAAKYALMITPALTALDFPLIGQVAGRTGLVREAKREVVRSIGRRILAEGGMGIANEGITEAIQEAIPLATASVLTNKDFATKENMWQILEAGAGGALAGGAVGGGSGVLRDKIEADHTPPKPEDIVDTHVGIMRREPPREDLTISSTRPAEMVQGTDPGGRVFSMPLETRPAPNFYSKLGQVVDEKLPASASAEQILGTLRGRVKDEEMADTGLLDWLAAQKGPVKKSDIKEFLAENSIELTEKIYADAATIQPGEEISPQSYIKWTTPGGEVSSYREILMKLPVRPDVEIGMDIQNFWGDHFSDANVLAHVRATTREDRNGIPVLHVEEIQSDWHQEGAKRGYNDVKPEELPAVNARMKELTKEEGELALQMQRYSGRDYNAAALAPLQAKYKANQDEQRTITRRLNAPPDAPFKKSWQELAIKRLIRYAADKGISRITLANGAEQDRRYGESMRDSGMLQQLKGLQDSYDYILPSKMKKIIKQLGGTWGETRLDGRWQPAFYIDIPESARSDIQRGLPMYSRMDAVPLGSNAQIQAATSPNATVLDPNKVLFKQDVHPVPRGALPTGVKVPGKAEVRYVDPRVQNHPMFPVAMKVFEALHNVNKRMGNEGIVYFGIHFDPTDASYGHTFALPDKNGQRPVWLNLAHEQTLHELWATATHEMGHVVFFEKLYKASEQTQQAILAAYEKWRGEFGRREGSYSKMVLSRFNIAGIHVKQAMNRLATDMDFSTGRTSNPDYWVSFHEWCAEQFARWATTDRVPLTIADRFFKGIMDSIRKLHELVYQRVGLKFEPDAAVGEWLKSFVKHQEYSVGEIMREAMERLQQAAQRILDRMGVPQMRAAPPQPELAGAKGMLGGLFGRDIPQTMREDAVLADRFNWVYKWGLSIVQVAKRNWWIRELQAYREDVQKMHIEVQSVMSKAHYVLKQLRDLGRVQEEAVYHVMDDLDKMAYRTPDEINQNVQRNPTIQEFQALVQKYKLTQSGLKALNNMRAMFDGFLGSNEQAAIELAQRTFTDPVKLMEVLTGIKESFRAMRNRPYFPHMQFGEHTLKIVNAAGHIIHLESFERRGLKSAERVREERIRELMPLLNPGESIQRGKWERDVRPLVGMPKGLLDILAEKMDLSDKQREALDELRFAAAPQASFRHRFQRRKNIDGYSMDFRRAFATYFFHGAHFLGKSKYMDRLTGHIKALKQSTKARGPDGRLLHPDVDRRMDIVNYLHDHKQNLLDVKSDWAALRAITFVWSLGYSPAAAALNMTQLMVGTYPFLAAQFGDHRAIGAMTRAGAQLSTYYKKGTLQNVTEDDLRAMKEAMLDGTLTEAMAPQLAAAANQNNLMTGMAGNLLQRGWQHFMEKSAFLFEMTEQMNRRITFRAAWKLALENPKSKFVEKAVRENPDKMARLMGPTQNGGLGWSEANARAYVAAKDAVESTQYVYAPYARPRFMRGKLGTVFMFKMFVQNTLFMLWNYPSTAIRSILVMGFMGGLMGLPGGDDVKEILRAIAYQVFGKDFNLEREARRLILDMSDGKIPPDLILHGLSRRGMGIPAVLDAMGSTVGMTDPGATADRFLWGRTDKEKYVKSPILDWSRSVGMGSILPVQLGEIFGPPNKDESKAMADQVQRASGAAFGVWFNILKAATDAHTEAADPKRWERAVPRAFGAVSKAFRIGIEGRERTRTGATLQQYDVHDTEQLAEVVAMGLGFNPLASSAQWDRIIAEREAQEFWDINRGILLEQYSKALRTGNADDQEKVFGAIQKFNDELPDAATAKKITPEVIRNSVRTRQRGIAAQESGVPISKRARGVATDIQSLFPESTVDVRRVR